MKLERWFGRFAIPQLPLLIAVGNGIVYLLRLQRPEITGILSFVPERIVSGEIWRLVTYLFIPPAMQPFFIIFWLYIIYVYANGLEQEWGEFRFNVFYVMGALCVAVAGLLFGIYVSNVPLNTTLFLAFAAMYPDFEMLLFFFLPVKVKYLAWLAWVGVIYSLVLGAMATRITVVASLLNYVLFFGAHHWETVRLRLTVYRNRRRFYK